jgi:hypothetical protein
MNSRVAVAQRIAREARNLIDHALLASDFENPGRNTGSAFISLTIAIELADAHAWELATVAAHTKTGFPIRELEALRAVCGGIEQSFHDYGRYARLIDDVFDTTAESPGDENSVSTAALIRRLRDGLDRLGVVHVERDPFAEEPRFVWFQST